MKKPLAVFLVLAGLMAMHGLGAHGKTSRRFVAAELLERIGAEMTEAIFGTLRLLLVVPLLIAVAMLTYMERKVIASMQLRKGPNIVGPFGLLQPFADGLKLFLKETIIPTKANKVKPSRVRPISAETNWEAPTCTSYTTVLDRALAD